MDKDTKLKACPFCGGEAREIFSGHQVVCLKCGATAKSIIGVATAVWNIRPSISTERLEEIIDDVHDYNRECERNNRESGEWIKHKDLAQAIKEELDV